MISEQFLIDIILKRDKVEDFSAFPFSLNACRHLERLTLHPKVTFFVGENGSGKSTLLEAIAVANGFNPEGGSKNFGFSTRASHSNLDKYIRCSKGVKKPRGGYFLRAESFYNVATEIEALDTDEPGVRCSPPLIIDSYGGKSLHEQSHGESFFALMLNRFSGKSLYILDEPEAALSPSRQLSMMHRMHELVLQDCQFLIATHSPILMAYPEADIQSFGTKGLEKTAYEDTEHYQVMKSFMNDPAGMINRLL
ncbi:AAA family ATPase [bacterium]|nr:AAA family ATPase [bacterium]